MSGVEICADRCNSMNRCTGFYTYLDYSNKIRCQLKSTNPPITCGDSLDHTLYLKQGVKGMGSCSLGTKKYTINYIRKKRLIIYRYIFRKLHNLPNVAILVTTLNLYFSMPTRFGCFFVSK